MNENCEPVRLRLVCNQPRLMIPVVGEISRLERPNFDFRGQKGLHVCWGKYKRTRHTRRSIDPGLMAVAWAIGCLRPYSFAPVVSSDGKKLWESAS